jgi:hypothetical protein
MKRLLLSLTLAGLCIGLLPSTSQAGTTSGYPCFVRLEDSNTLRIHTYSEYGCQGSLVGDYSLYSEDATPAAGRVMFRFKRDAWLTMVNQVMNNRYSKLLFENRDYADGLQAIGFWNGW